MSFIYAESYCKSLPISDNSITIENQVLQIETAALGNIMKTYRIVSPATFNYKGALYNSNEWVIKTANPQKAPPRKDRLFEVADRTAAFLLNQTIATPETLISPITYGHQTDGRFWVTRNISNPIDPNAPLSQAVKDFIKKIFAINSTNTEFILKLKPDNIRLNNYGTPYFTGTTRSNEGRIDALTETLMQFPSLQDELMDGLPQNLKQQLSGKFSNKRAAENNPDK